MPLTAPEQIFTFSLNKEHLPKTKGLGIVEITDYTPETEARSLYQFMADTSAEQLGLFASLALEGFQCCITDTSECYLRIISMLWTLHPFLMEWTKKCKQSHSVSLPLKTCLNGQLPYQLQDEKWHTVILPPKESADQRTVICALEHMTYFFFF